MVSDCVDGLADPWTRAEYPGGKNDQAITAHPYTDDCYTPYPATGHVSMPSPLPVVNLAHIASYLLRPFFILLTGDPLTDLK